MIVGNFLPLLFVSVASVAFISSNVANVCLKTFYSTNSVKHVTLVVSTVQWLELEEPG